MVPRQLIGMHFMSGHSLPHSFGDEHLSSNTLSNAQVNIKISGLTIAARGTFFLLLHFLHVCFWLEVTTVLRKADSPSKKFFIKCEEDFRLASVDARTISVLQCLSWLIYGQPQRTQSLKS